jgi:hypothetical protein
MTYGGKVGELVLPRTSCFFLRWVALMMDAVSTAENSVICYETARHNVPEDSLHTRPRVSLLICSFLSLYHINWIIWMIMGIISSSLIISFGMMAANYISWTKCHDMPGCQVCSLVISRLIRYGHCHVRHVACSIIAFFFQCLLHSVFTDVSKFFRNFLWFCFKYE